MEITPIFFDHSSHKSILTFWDDKDIYEDGPQSIIQLCKAAGIKTCTFVSSNFHTYVEALKACEKADIQLRFGLIIDMCANIADLSPQSLASEHKIIVFQKNTEGYKDLIALKSAWSTNKDARYYKIRFDYNELCKYWTDNLLLALPFFSSFIAKNSTRIDANIVPKFPTKNIILFREKNSQIPFESIINSNLDKFQDENCLNLNTKTIYYKNYSDFSAWQVYRSIHLKSTFTNPEMSHCCSDTFCFEDYLKLKNL